MVTVQLFVVDAFTSVPFTGNPAGVCLLDGDAQPGLPTRTGCRPSRRR